jgi:SAM-dependent methyltransferase
VVATLALCTIPDDRRAVAEAARVLRPGGQLLLLEHVRSPIFPVRALQSILNPLSVLLENDLLLREPLRHVEDAGLVVERLERSKWGIVERHAAYRP